MELQFGSFRLNLTERRLAGRAGPIELSARSFDILALLLRNPDGVVRKGDILDAVWPGLAVEENTLHVHVSALRKALGAGMVMTVHGQGYKYTGPRPVAVAADDAPAPDPAADAGRHPMLSLSGGKAVPVTGGCLCGEVRFRITAPALDTCFCHCRMCQRFTGSVFSVGSVYALDAVTVTRGEARFYASSPFAERGFCATCGASLFYRPRTPPVSPDWENWVLVYTGTLDNPVPNVPTWHLGIESQMPWLDLPIGTKRVRCQDSPDIVEAWAAFGLPVP